MVPSCVETVREIGTEAARYICNLFSSTNQTNPANTLWNINLVVTESMNETLLTAITTEEIRTKLFSIGGTPAPGPDGFSAAFYQNYWEIVGPAMVKEVQRFFETWEMPKEWNHTDLCLIP